MNTPAGLDHSGARLSHGPIDRIGRSAFLLVATDFDGTLAPIVSEPELAEADRAALLALKTLAGLPQTHVAIISGRSLSDLAQRTRSVENARLIGGHGSEFERASTIPSASDAAHLLNRIAAFLSELVRSVPGVRIERKPDALALHYRKADERAAETAQAMIAEGPATWPGVHVRHGKKVIELGVVATDKGVALRRMRQQVGATAVLFIGDDITDEDAFATLSPEDVGVKVGPGETSAAFRAADSAEVAALLTRVAEQRSAWLAGSHYTPIERHALISDQRTVALVDPNARIVWMCLPRIDSSAVFAELLGGPMAGFFDVSPVSASVQPNQAYVGDSFVLETRWGDLCVTDYLDCGGGRAFQRAGRTDLIRVISGHGRVRVVFAPRINFGRMETRLAASDQGIAVLGMIDPLVLFGPQLPWRILTDARHQVAVAEFDLQREPTVLELRYGTAGLEPNPQDEPMRRMRTEKFWSGWAASLSPPATARNHVMRSALMLKALTYGPTGAIAAAGTTSLPEHAGGVRNWDYRFCWPRDAALACGALLRLGAPGPGIKLLEWLLGILDRGAAGGLLCPLYSVTGQHAALEGEIAELAGYRGSRPVRIGNAAALQAQLDVFGPIAELLARLAESGAALSAEHWGMMESMVSVVEQRWREPDHGIWEARRPQRRHVHSKVMCWQTVDRGLAVAQYLGHKRPAWHSLREQISQDVLERGWSASAQAFCATYDDCEADAAALSIGLSGLLPSSDPRFRLTVEHIERSLRVGGTVYRYRYDDGLPGREGSFHLCTGWLIEAYAALGRWNDAHALFESLLGCVGPTGLLSEECDPESGAALGNAPQAYSHIALIHAAFALDRH